MMSLCDASMTSLVDVIYHVTCLDMWFVIVALNPEPTTVCHARLPHPTRVWTVHVHTKQSKYEKYLNQQKCDVIPALTGILGHAL